MKAIVNVNECWGIGKNGELLCYLPEDMKFFRTETKGKVLVMGRKTLIGFPGAKPLKGRVNLVLTKNPGRIPAESFAAASAEEGTELLTAGSVDEALKLLSAYEEDRIYCIGGEQIYRALLPYCSSCLVTFNSCREAADTFFPDLSVLPEWRLFSSSEEKEHEGIRYRFTEYRRAGDTASL